MFKHQIKCHLKNCHVAIGKMTVYANWCKIFITVFCY
jgi:hypothetical protein